MWCPTQHAPSERPDNVPCLHPPTQPSCDVLQHPKLFSLMVQSEKGPFAFLHQVLSEYFKCKDIQDILLYLATKTNYSVASNIKSNGKQLVEKVNFYHLKIQIPCYLMNNWNWTRIITFSQKIIHTFNSFRNSFQTQNNITRKCTIIKKGSLTILFFLGTILDLLLRV